MNKTVQLVNEWAAFSEAHPDADIEAFCRYYLTVQRSKLETGKNFYGGAIPPNPKSYLMKLMGFLCRASHTYFDKAFESIPEIRQKEDFFILNIVKNCGECRKTDVINQQLLGLSTGIDIINRLIDHALIVEKSDPTDKRAKLLSISEKGLEVLERSYTIAQKVNDIILHDLSDDDVQLCIQLLRGAEARQSAKIIEMKDKPIDEVFEKMVGSAPAAAR